MAGGLAGAVLLPIAGTAVLLRAVLPALWARSRLFAVSLSTIVGLAAASLMFSVSLFGVGARWSGYVPLEIGTWVTILGVGALRLRAAGHEPMLHEPAAWAAPDRLWAVVFAVALAISIAHFVVSSLAAPSGEWDAWAIWNLHARFLHRGPGAHWRDGFVPALAWSSPDYPLLLPASVARVWLYMGTESRLAPIAIAALFKYAVVGMMVGSLAAYGRRWAGLCAAAIVLSSGGFNFWAAAQIADIPLAAFVLGATVLLAHLAEGPSRSPWIAVLLGFCAGAAAWTKNEGVVFAVSALLVAAIVLLHRRAGAGAVAALFSGLALPGLVWWYFKANVATASPVVPSTRSAWGLALDAPRHLSIVRAFLDELWAWNTRRPVGLLPFVGAYTLGATLVSGVRVAALIAGIPLVTLLCSYYVVYVLSPAADLSWHIGTSLTRILVHVWPAGVYLAFWLPADGSGRSTWSDA